MNLKYIKDEEDLNSLLKQAKQVFEANFPKETSFERAVFFSWGCSVGDCGFCYMSKQSKDKLPPETKRSPESILAEFLIAKHLGWDIGFFTGGIGVLKPSEMEELLKQIHEVSGEKIWLSVGAVSRALLERYKPYIKGVVGSTETINPTLHKKVCPSKPLEPYERMFESAEELGLERAMTFIVGLGETKEDLTLLKQFIEKYKIDKIHIYGLIPTKGTEYENANVPSKEEQAWWIAQLRVAFPKLDIQCGIWEDRAERIAYLLEAGANSISKFKAIKLFGSSVAHEIEQEASLAGRHFKGSLTKLPEVNWDAEVDNLSFTTELREKLRKKLKEYLVLMQKEKLILVKKK